MKNYFMVIDTETADLAGNVYDVGYVICDKKGIIVKMYNALVRETFTDGQKMMGAFFAKKVFSHYAVMLDNDEIKLQNWDTIVNQINSDIYNYNVTCITAYNAAFDFRVMAKTHEALGFVGNVLQFPIKTLDIWRFACETKLQQKTYRKLAKQEGWVSNAGNLKSGAEYAYRFCSGDWGFIEDHTALSDAIIESQILAACFASRKKIPYDQIKGIPPWKLIQE